MLKIVYIRKDQISSIKHQTYQSALQFGWLQTHYTLFSLWFQGFTYISCYLYAKLLCCLDIFAFILPDTKSFQYLENVYFIFFHMISGMIGKNRPLKRIHLICLTVGIPLNQKKCMWRSLIFSEVRSCIFHRF